MSIVPDGHPGDLAWRLPVWRTLLKLQLVTPDQLEPANQKAKAGGFFVSHLVAMGVNPDKLLTAVAIATGLPSAPRLEVRRPSAGLAEGLDAGALRALLAVPFRKEAGLLHVAFVVPMPKERLAALPPHKAFVALESDVRLGLEALFPSRGKKDAPAPEFDPFFAELPPPPSAPPAVPAPDTTADAMKRAGLVETHTHGRDELLNSLGRLKWVAAGALALLVGVKAASWIIDASRGEAEKRGAELRQGMVASAGGRKGSLDEVSTALANVDVAARKKDEVAFRSACFALADALRAYAPVALSTRQIGPLQAMATETSMACERQPSLEDWLALRQRIQDVLKGDP